MHKKQSKNNKLWLIIPAYNEENTIGQVINSALKTIDNVLIVNDSSSDNTLKIIETLPVKIMSNKLRLGYTKSIERGISYAFNHDAQYVITFDADGQHFASDLLTFIRVLNTNKPHLVVGNRAFKNRLVEKIFGKYTKRYFNISDPFCGFKAYSKIFFEIMGKRLETSYSLGTEKIFVTLLNKKLHNRIYEIDITTAKRQDHPRFAGQIMGNLLEIRAVINILKSIYYQKNQLKWLRHV